MVVYSRRVGRPKHVRCRVSDIRKLAALQVTEREAAAFFGMRAKTFRQLLATDELAAQAWEEGQQSGLTRLREIQFRLARKSASMAVFLGKQYLKQNEILITEHSGRDGAPIETMDYSKLDAAERKDLRAILLKARSSES